MQITATQESFQASEEREGLREREREIEIMKYFLKFAWKLTEAVLLSADTRIT